MRSLLACAAVSALLALGACGKQTELAEATPNYDGGAVASPATTAGDLTKAQDFVDKVSQANMTEIQTAQLALTKASNPAIKSYAQMIVDDHTRAGEDLRGAILTAALMSPAATLDSDHQARIDDLTADPQGSAPDKAKAGMEWDHDFITQQIDMHEDAISLFEDYAQNGDVPAVKTFAATTLPTLRTHLEQARQLETQVDDENPLTPN